jgi:hypothetical protein
LFVPNHNSTDALPKAPHDSFAGQFILACEVSLGYSLHVPANPWNEAEGGEKVARIGLIVLVTFSLAAVGCGKSYYIVNDPFTGKTYYTKDVDRFNSGNVSFKDEKTGKKVSIQNSEIQEVTSTEYQKALDSTAPPAVPAPKPAPAPVAPTQ